MSPSYQQLHCSPEIQYQSSHLYNNVVIPYNKVVIPYNKVVIPCGIVWVTGVPQITHWAYGPLHEGDLHGLLKLYPYIAR